MSDLDILSIDRGLVVAPAGCGKTQLISDAIKRHPASKPVLVLTHTNAGVASLRGRLERAGVPSASYKLSTIDGWAIRLASMFPLRSQVSPETLALSNPGTHYPAIREAAIRLLEGKHIEDCLQATYARLLVDEYQDCSIRQHEIVSHAANAIPTCVLGDPLQAIFGFSANDPLAGWDKTCAVFPKLGDLEKPWRWINAGCEDLGRWLLIVRQDLLDKKTIDLGAAPKEVTWVQLDGTAQDHGRLANAARWTGKGSADAVLVIGDSRNAASRHQIASTVQGATIIEPVDLGQLVTFLRYFDLQATDALDRLLKFAEEMMNGVGRAQLLRRLDTITGGSARKEATLIEKTALSFRSDRTPASAADLLSVLGNGQDIRVYRPTVFRGCIRALHLAATTQGLSLHDAAIQIREQNRAYGRPLPRRAVGSTLLLKGLESDAVVVLNADDLDAANLYVAMTRGSKSLTICSRSSVLSPHRLT